MEPEEREERMRDEILGRGNGDEDGGNVPIVVDPSDDLYDASTPRGRAFDWLVNEDGRRVCPGGTNDDYEDNDRRDDDDYGEGPSLIQRYALAVLYYSTSGDDWRSRSSKAPPEKEKEENDDDDVKKRGRD